MRELLENAGIYATPQRLAVAEALFAKHQHITADQLSKEVDTATRGSVSRATVYNTLYLFSEKGLVKEIYVDASRTFYDSNTQPHFHLYNIDTCQLTDMENQAAARFLSDNLPQGAILHDIEVVVRVRDSAQPPA